MVKHKTKNYIIIIIIGLALVAAQSSGIKWNVSLITILILGDILFPNLLGWLRAKCTLIWANKNQIVMRKGNIVTIVLWLIYIIGHGALTYFVRDNENFMLFSIGISLLVQREVIWIDSRKKFSIQIRNNERLQLYKK
ncbi:hypothetical protein [Lactococcus cremoris]|uniref:hypothetical protein n=1 Tax=Lactococcus lactis subsp. cremoris TaxID=1359 RepID=UPI0012DA4F17|nr:hypothetical protein [Lactococcus cremoris]